MTTFPSHAVGELASDAYLSIADVVTAGEAYGHACAHEMHLEDQRSLIKPMVIERIKVAFNLSATAAEKIVEQDEEYAAHRKKQSACVVAKERARGEYEAAKLRAQLGVALVQVDAPSRTPTALRRALVAGAAGRRARRRQGRVS
jgi:hypothetical protein